jgi:hypothetical protein
VRRYSRIENLSSQFDTTKWKTVTVQQSLTIGHRDGRVSIGLWTVELGPIAFEVSQRAIDALRKDLAAAEKLLQQRR